ncbi:MAG: hypothetical protein ACPGVH_01375 [Chitinophagales bacterium]
MKYYLFLIVLFSFSCKPEKEFYKGNCDSVVELNQRKYNNASSDYFQISNAEIIGDCLNITIVASGCSGDSWEVELINSKAIAESNPVQKYFKLILNNQELCHAVISKIVSFNLNPSKIGDDFIINLDSWDGSLLFEE